MGGWLVVVAALGVVGWWIHRADGRRMRGAFEELAARHGGTVERSALRLPRLEVPLGRTTLVVSGTYGQHASTDALAMLGGEHRFFEVVGHRPRVIDELFASPAMDTGDAAFDERYSVRTDWPLEVDALLDADLRRALLVAPRNRGFRLRLRPLPDGTPRLDLHVDGVVSDAGVLVWLAETALLVLDRLGRPRAARAA